MELGYDGGFLRYGAGGRRQYYVPPGNEGDADELAVALTSYFEKLSTYGGFKPFSGGNVGSQTVMRLRRNGQ